MVLLVFVSIILGISTISRCDLDSLNAMSYLAKYGYMEPLPENGDNLMDPESFKVAVEEFQAFAGLNVTGILDDATISLMGTPRCGVKDKVKITAKIKRYTIEGSIWRNKNLTYGILNYPLQLNQSEVDAEFHKAFAVWANYTNLSFTPTRKNPNIVIVFASGYHGHEEAFDGPGKVLAHAYYPKFGGGVHFDNTENWSVNNYIGTNLFAVAVHEIGHTLGLKHSRVPDAIMAPFYRGYNPIFQLHKDDIDGIQLLYGEKEDNSVDNNIIINPRSFDPEPEEVVNELCRDPKVNAIFTSVQGDTYVFKGDKYWIMSTGGLAGPKNISQKWPGVPNNIDAVFTHRNGQVFFFKGSKYWRFSNNTLDKHYPKKISVGFTGIPNNVDAAIEWRKNRKVYFFKGSKYWKYDALIPPAVDSFYPKQISAWNGLPNDLSAAFHYNDVLYFVKGGAYYEYDDDLMTVKKVDPPYPKSMSYWFFGCKNTPSGTLKNPN